MVLSAIRVSSEAGDSKYIKVSLVGSGTQYLLCSENRILIIFFIISLPLYFMNVPTVTPS